MNDLANKENSEFWDEPCGVKFAGERGFDIESCKGLDAFDQAYFEFYPYLKKYLDELIPNKRKVLEVGLGLGTVSRYLATRIVDFDGVDISKGPCNFVAKSLKERKLQGSIHCASVLDMPLIITQNKYDLIVAIGSLHHTGNLENALTNLESLLSQNGILFLMIYNEFDLFRLFRHPIRSISRSKLAKNLIATSWPELDSRERAFSDIDSLGRSAPYTAYSSRHFFKSRSLEYSVRSENFHNIRLPVLKSIRIPRNFLLEKFSKFCGCNLYAIGEKK